MSWMLPARAAQAVLSIVVLGLMAYGMFGCPHLFFSPKLTCTYSIVMVVKSLATVVSNRDQLPNLRASLESSDARSFDAHLAGQIHPLGRTNHDEVGFVGH